MKRALLATLVAATALLLPAASAGAVIKVQKGMAGTRLNQTKRHVRGVLGTPRKVKHGTNTFGSFTEYRYRGRLTVSFQGNRRVTAISTTGTSERTGRGAGVGSSVASVRDKVRGIHCNSFGGIRTCQVGSSRAGHRVTVFIFNRLRRVKRVTVGFVID